MSSWCSGHHICLTRRRSLVRAQARTNRFTRLTMFGAKNSKMDKNKANYDPCIWLSRLLHTQKVPGSSPVALDVKCCNGPVVKALDLKSIGIFPRRLKSYSQRYLGIIFLESMILCNLIIVP
ncbi:hypothetical protein T07_11001 [Trichinella nelsoni]|uniref:Uncharacterized protein n=1 Tax=Trichinella nelsoni TaxID=6336 RepID=A0A0V0SKX0_9BILA|nr:hypothetical protein T07_11001 [Trichinella nelsoni]